MDSIVIMNHLYFFLVKIIKKKVYSHHFKETGLRLCIIPLYFFFFHSKRFINRLFFIYKQKRTKRKMSKRFHGEAFTTTTMMSAGGKTHEQEENIGPRLIRQPRRMKRLLGTVKRQIFGPSYDP
ncbi:hypothetical protein BDA99DRAFT_61883 [Phascolomyces articulosus]|uniref:Uncharacterized protein n=1 Tax=Phascolomyces articulosus TaxID=60185 RepID=A0AAD5PDY4_9FUNG|nr:hypothetical protein BDA99DRAFT_61883 [Phascolomyces articulosus]